MMKIYKFQDLVSKTPKIRGIQTAEYKDIGKYPVIDQGNKFIAGYSDNEKAIYKDTLPVVVFGDHTLSIKYVDFPFCAGADGTQILKPNKEIIIGKFLYYSIINLNIQSLGYSRHFKVLKEAIFRVPEIEDQKRIVKILDEADALRKKRKQAIRFLDDYLKSVFFEMFGDPVKNPKGWETKQIKKLGIIKTGTTPPSNKDGMFVGGNIPFITPGDLEKDYTKRFLTEAGLLKSRTVRKGATMICCIGATIGKIGIAKEVSGFNQQINSIEWDQNLIKDLFGYFSMKFMKNTIISKGISTTLPILKKSEFEKINIPVPNMELQEIFEKKYVNQEALKQTMLTQSTKLETQFQALMQKAFRGEI